MLTKTVTEHLKDLLDNGGFMWYDRKNSEFVITIKEKDYRGFTLGEVTERALWRY